jgi:hypothetical protein
MSILRELQRRNVGRDATAYRVPAIRDDPRWAEYREAVGMSQERLDAIEFDPWLPE